MGILYTYKCDKCGWIIFNGIASNPYYEKKPGFFRKLLHLRPKKIYFQEPPINQDNKFNLKKDAIYTTEKWFCSDCGKLFDVDNKYGDFSCKYCKSNNTNSLHSLIGTECFKCKKGKIVAKQFGIT